MGWTSKKPGCAVLPRLWNAWGGGRRGLGDRGGDVGEGVVPPSGEWGGFSVQEKIPLSSQQGRPLPNRLNVSRLGKAQGVERW